MPSTLLLLASLALADPGPGPVEQVLVGELERARAAWTGTPDAPYYVAMAVEERDAMELSALAGTLADAEHRRERFLDVDLRVGEPELDSTHPLRGMSAIRGEDRDRVRLPVDDAPPWALEHAVWRELDARLRDARERYVVVQANLSVKAEEETPAPDFTLGLPPVVDRQELSLAPPDLSAWEGVITRVSHRLDQSARVHHSRVVLAAEQVRKTFVDTEGSRLVHGGGWYRVGLSVAATAADGDEIRLVRQHSARSLAGLPGEADLAREAEALVAELEAQLDAPRGQPYIGPVILEGRAAAVFFHEVLGHRVEGHRQKRDDEGKTFAEYVGQAILPPFLDVYDDPTLEALADQELDGSYAYDDEGVPARRAVLVEDGRFVGFLMGRSPLPRFTESNGHARRMAGRAPVTRMGNTIVEASRTVPRAALREALLAEVRRQGLPYGVVVREIEGGFTTTGRVMPNAFNVRVLVAERVWADGRPDDRIRGVDLVGTPLVAFSNVVAAGDDPQVFNGSCGAESGWVPVSAVSPSLLIRNLEFQLKEKGEDRPPLLPKPDPGEDDRRALVPAEGGDA